MANDNHIKNFTAADIEKYHCGMLSAKQMHDMEKAALDDPFLADALEGYAVAGVNANADIIDLKKRLADKMESKSAKVIAMHGGESRKSFPWWRAAAAVVIIGAGALLANQFLFTKNNTQDIAQVNPATVENRNADTVKDTTASTAKIAGENEEAVTEQAKVETTTGGSGEKNTPATQGKKTSDPSIVISDDAVANKKSSAIQDPISVPVATGSAPMAPEAKDYKADTRSIATRKQEENKNAAIAKKERSVTEPAVVAAENNSLERAIASRRKDENDGNRFQNTNLFRGRVTDAYNVGVPFANVTNVDDKVGTYTDANGNFNFVSQDTVLTVQVRSIGFENNQVQLRNAAPTNRVVLQEDRSLSEVVISNAKPNAAARNRDMNKTLEEPEPADGWDNYDVYLVNNLEAPDELKSKPNNHGVVEVSFEVDKNGEPVNIRIEKSLCSQCDKEARRLIKEGPKWKRNANKKGRTTVRINF